MRAMMAVGISQPTLGNPNLRMVVIMLNCEIYVVGGACALDYLVLSVFACVSQLPVGL
jgi:hypothetical protein